MCPKVMQHRQITLGAKKYVVQQLLGEGGFARVFKAQEQQPGGNILAVKVRAKNLEDILSSIIVLLNVVFPQAGLSYYFCRKHLIIIIIIFLFSLVSVRSAELCLGDVHSERSACPHQCAVFQHSVLNHEGRSIPSYFSLSTMHFPGDRSAHLHERLTAVQRISASGESARSHK